LRQAESESVVDAGVLSVICQQTREERGISRRAAEDAEETRDSIEEGRPSGLLIFLSEANTVEMRGEF